MGRLAGQTPAPKPPTPIASPPPPPIKAPAPAQERAPLVMQAPTNVTVQTDVGALTAAIKSLASESQKALQAMAEENTRTVAAIAAEVSRAVAKPAKIKTAITVDSNIIRDMHGRITGFKSIVRNH
jgi:hypothetical protein